MLCALYLFRCPQRTEETVVFPGIGVTGGCEHPYVDSRSLIWVLCKSSLSALNCCAITSSAFTSIFEIYWIIFKMHLCFKINRKLATRLGSENCPSPQYITMPFYLSFTVCNHTQWVCIFFNVAKTHLPQSVASTALQKHLLTPCFLTLEIQLSIFSCFEFLIQVLAI